MRQGVAETCRLLGLIWLFTALRLSRHILNAAFIVTGTDHTFHSNVAAANWVTGFRVPATNLLAGGGECVPSLAGRPVSPAWEGSAYANQTMRNVARHNRHGVVLLDERLWECALVRDSSSST